MSTADQAPAPAPSLDDVFSPIAWRDGTLYLLDQTRLPKEEVWLRCDTPQKVADAIYRLSVRGAPAIGVAAAYGLVVGLQGVARREDLGRRFDEVAELLLRTRPTAVNLRWAIARGRAVFEGCRDQEPETVRRTLLDWAHELHARDVETNRRIGEHGAALFAPGDRVLTHCNAGGLATGGYGTAVGVITSCHRHGRLGQVWVDETRPLLQGARLTAWELERLGIPYRLVTDSSAGALMARGLVDRVVVGADRIARNGDVANKIGTYVVAVLAKRHGVPFYVAAPLSTIDPDTPSGDAIPIEERAPDEVTEVFGTRVAPAATSAQNFAFDVTPAELVTAIITEAGVLTPPYEESIGAALAERPPG
ncbi:MAG: S-methyl-5-thioribose-1-phosphate isomerase [Acidobacteria bacterium]|nr:MAG: S-methyl-5-thioribose-1-phosphate isomerase [Acidobacteriota bacterium]